MVSNVNLKELIYKIDGLSDYFYDNEYNKDSELVLIASSENLLSLLQLLRDNDSLRFKILADIGGVDYIVHSKFKKRFCLVYNLLSIKYNQRIFIKVFVNCDNGELVPSVTSLFSSALWMEREAFDMFGIKFSDMPDDRRLLTDYGFKHFPLRKDFPVTGYEEDYYDLRTEKVTYKPVELDQDFRDYDFKSPWNGVEKKLSEVLQDPT